MDVESKIDAVLEQEQAAHTEKARAAIRARVIEDERLAQLAKEQAAANAARAAYLERVAARYEQACAEYKIAVDAFRAARCRLQALDTILNRSGFSNLQLGVALRHAIAAPDEGDLDSGYRAAEDSIRKSLGG
jgi:sRNA-binding protein